MTVGNDGPPQAPPQGIEIFSGIGGWTAAAQGLVEIVAAWDISDAANKTYRHNWGSSPEARNLVGVVPEDLLRHGEAGWLMSPPCQPFSTKGEQRDMEDPRAAPLLRLIRILHEVLPRFLLLENVPPFGASRTRERLVKKLGSLEYDLREVEICPTELGIPNLRRRYYLLARRRPLAEPPPLPQVGKRLVAYLDPAPAPELTMDREVIHRRGRGMDFVTPESARTACFGSSYGRALKRAGSYLSVDGGARRFSPEEMVRLLHFPDDFSFPPDIPLRTRYKLAGNSVNVEVLRSLVRWSRMP